MVFYRFSTMASATQKQPILAAALKEGHAPQKMRKK